MVGAASGQSPAGQPEGVAVSVINKMLRDLDQQAASGAAASASGCAPGAIMRGTVSVSGVAVAPSQGVARRQAGLIALVVLLAVGAVAAVWFWPGEAIVPATRPVASAVLAAAPQAAAIVVVPAVAQSPLALTNAPALEPNPAVPVGRVAPALAPALAAPPPAAPRLPALPAVPPQVLPTIAIAIATAPAKVEAAPASAPRLAAAVVEPRSAAPSWQEAAQDALGQAQRLWAGGAREGATDLLGEALAVVERFHRTDMVGSGATVVLAMLREQVRMDLALGQPAAVLALLKRFERVAANQPDLWALRANAAQNLGQPVEAALAYQNALRLRPGEPRWMLGAAVALAAQGQTAAAAEFAEQARVLTTVSPDVLTYLRQAGVPLR